MTIKNRVISQGIKNADEFDFNPLNWRKHPKTQIEALRGILNEVGWVQNVIINERTGHLLDGHARVELALKTKDQVPYISVDLSLEEEKLILAVFDPISAMAEMESEKLAKVLQDIKTDNNVLQEMLNSLAKENNLFEGDDIKFKEYDESIATDVDMVTCPSCGNSFLK